jgi:hypothetical protein
MLHGGTISIAELGMLSTQGHMPNKARQLEKLYCVNCHLKMFVQDPAEAKKICTASVTCLVLGTERESWTKKTHLWFGSCLLGLPSSSKACC